MRESTVVVIAGAVGGLLWLVRWVADVDALLWPGAVLLSVVALAAGASLVRPVVLRVVVGTCVVALAWSLAAVVGVQDSLVVGGVVGAVVALGCLAALPRTLRGPAGAGAGAAAEPARAPVEEAAPTGPRRRADRRSRPGR
ncbi:hypothetical protein [Nocardioides sp.]|uniref:hypothetical protein n=1 Tax=Nocardioides sp. TaxID=35761 RepID=UPI0026073964|nr:hypothetical protein [Nocardioides sp.]